MSFHGDVLIFGYLFAFVAFRFVEIVCFVWHHLARLPGESRWCVIDRGRRV